MIGIRERQRRRGFVAFASMVTVAAGVVSAGDNGTAVMEPQMNVFRAGGNPGSGAGTPPVLISIPPTAISISFPQITGEIQYGPGIPPNGPDGVITACELQPDVGGIAGAASVLRGRALLGVFLGDATPAAPAPAQIEYMGDVAAASYAPGIGQVFFIGDGGVGIEDPDAAKQVFEVPDGATRLYLGLYDGTSCGGPPTAYGDNSGSFSTDYAIVALPCGDADLVEPTGVLDLADVAAFVSAFGGGEPIADLAPPMGVFDLADIGVFVTAFTAGCP